MGNEAAKKFTWVIKKFSSLKSEHIYSDQLVVGGCKWRLLAYTRPVRKGRTKYLSLYLEVADPDTLPFGWRRHTKYSLTIINQLSEQLSEVQETQHWFDQQFSLMGYPDMIPLTKLYDKDGGFLVNGDLKIDVEIDVLEVIENLDVSLKSREVTQPRKKIKLNDDDATKSKDLLKETSSVKESIDVNAFQVHPSQVKFVSRVFKNYPDIALQLRAKNEPLRSSCLHVFLGLVKTLCKSFDELSNDSLVEADNSLIYLKGSSIKVDWLAKKVEEVKENKKQEQIGAARTQELKESLKIFKLKCSDKEALLEKEKVELKELKQKCSDLEAVLEKEKAKFLAARAPPLTLDEVV